MAETSLLLQYLYESYGVAGFIKKDLQIAKEPEDLIIFNALALQLVSASSSTYNGLQESIKGINDLKRQAELMSAKLVELAENHVSICIATSIGLISQKDAERMRCNHDLDMQTKEVEGLNSLLKFFLNTLEEAKKINLLVEPKLRDQALSVFSGNDLCNNYDANKQVEYALYQKMPKSEKLPTKLEIRETNKVQPSISEDAEMPSLENNLDS